jgi:hypothetical protein
MHSTRQRAGRGEVVLNHRLSPGLSVYLTAVYAEVCTLRQASLRSASRSGPLVLRGGQKVVFAASRA